MVLTTKTKVGMIRQNYNLIDGINSSAEAKRFTYETMQRNIISSRPGQRIKPAQRWLKPGQRCKNLKLDQQLLNQGSRPPFHHICISGLISRTTLKPEHICAMLISCLGQFGHGRHFRCLIRLQVYFIINLERGI